MAESDLYSASWVPAPGTVLEDRYRVLRNLDKGGMGVLLRAEDTELNREVAIKMVSPKLARTGNYRDRFEREVELASRIAHPNVIRCHDYGVTPAGALFLVMELLDGLGLKEVVRNDGRLSTRRTADLGMQLLEGLSAAHSLGIIHRDLKPSNIYVVQDHDGTEVVKVLDFGLAKALENEQIRLTKTGMICGTAAYVAPESLVVDEPGRAGDVYAVGLIMLEMLFGRPVYTSTQMAQTFMEQLVVPARIPRRVWEDPLGRILTKALQKHPGERYQDAAEMLSALTAASDQIEDFLLANKEIPPAAHELPKELLDDLADGHYRTIDTLHKCPRPECWSSGDEEHIDDRKTLEHVLDDISRSDIHAAFDEILKGGGPQTPRLTGVQQHLEMIRHEKSGGGELSEDIKPTIKVVKPTDPQKMQRSASPGAPGSSSPMQRGRSAATSALPLVLVVLLVVALGVAVVLAAVSGEQPQRNVEKPSSLSKEPAGVAAEQPRPDEEPAEVAKVTTTHAELDAGPSHEEIIEPADSGVVEVADPEPPPKAAAPRPKTKLRPLSKPKSKPRPSEPAPAPVQDQVSKDEADRIVDQLPMP